MKKILSAIGVMFAFPIVALAQSFDTGEKFSIYLDQFAEFINDTLVPLVFGIAFLFFIWGAFRYFIQGGADEDKRKEGKNLMIYAIIGFVLMVSVWGIVNFISTGLGFDQLDVQQIPNAPTP